MNKLSTLSRLLQAHLLAPVFIVFLVAIIALRSFTPGTFLTGWDTLHPEFNFELSINRAIFGAWRSDQGLGSIAVHSHMADLPRIIQLYLTSFVLPIETLRYSYVLLSLFIGTLGAFYFFKHFFSGKIYQSLFGALFYLLNLATLQSYAMPFEMFQAMFAYLPWILLFINKYIKKGGSVNLFILFMLSFLASPMAYAATQFYAFFGYALLFVLGLVLVLRSRLSIRRALLSLAIILSANSYWLFHNIYTVVTKSSEVSLSEINRSFSEEAFLQNRAYGDVQSVLQLKNHLYSWQSYDFSQKEFVPSMSFWGETDRYELVAFGGIAVFVMAISLLLTKKYKLDAFILPTVLALFFIVNQNPPFESIYQFLRNNLSLIEEGFRMPFTKFSNLLAFSYSYYLVLGLVYISKFSKKVSAILTSLAIAVLISVSTPIFSNGIISPVVKVNIPNYYFDSFEYLNRNASRVLVLPFTNQWGWTYNSWGYQGSGFVWFGSNNQFLVRDFDRWNPRNEVLYKKFANSLLESDYSTFKALVYEYKIDNLYFDNSIIDPGNSNFSSKKVYEKLVEIYGKPQEFGEVKIFNTIDANENSNGVYVSFVNYDSRFSQLNPGVGEKYIQSDTGIFYPFVNLDDRSSIEIDKKDNGLIISADSPKAYSNYPSYVSSPAFDSTVINIKRERSGLVGSKELLSISYDEPKLFVDGKQVTNSEKESLIRFDFNLPDSLFVSIGSRSVEVQKEANLKVSGSGSIGIYGGDGALDVSRSWISEANVVDCVNSKSKTNTKKTSDSLLFTSESGESVCAGAGLNLTADSVLEVSYVSTKSLARLCINGSNGCINSETSVSRNLEGGLLVKERLILKAGNYWMVFVGQGAGELMQEFKVSDLKSSAFPLITSTKLENLSRDSVKTAANINSFSKVSLELPNSMALSQSSLLWGHQNSFNCDPSGRGGFGVQKSLESAYYQVFDQAVVCDYSVFEAVENTPYLLNISGLGVEGRGVKLYLFDETNKGVVAERVLDLGSFDNYIYVPAAKNPRKLVLNLEVRSFRRIPSKVSVSGISWYQLPPYLEKVALVSSVTPASNLQKIEDSFGPTSQIGLGIYSEYDVEGRDIVFTNRSFDPGFVAFAKGDYGFGIVRQSESNGWEGAYLIDGKYDRLYVLYLPQFLVFTGVAIVIVVSLGFLIGLFLVTKAEQSFVLEKYQVKTI